ncbi:MAG TPA: glycerophosphodiester phosphodiesterase [Acidimicrobiia bacterium]|nr:glycerophosphodiester phosphodiesterase [Acidimicrobiia bacterium]
MISGQQLKIIGHRGWPSRFPDNVLAGIAAAAEVCDMVEVDIRMTTDNALVLSHDPRLRGHLVAETSWADLATLDLGEGHHPLTLMGLIEALPGLSLNLEIKNFPGDAGFDPEHRLARMTADLARPADLVTCFNWPTVDLLRSTHPEIATGLLVDDGWSLGDAVEHAAATGHRAVVPHWELALASPEAVGAAVAAGLMVVVWTLNDPVVATKLAAAGVEAIITDDPGEMRRALRE